MQRGSEAIGDTIQVLYQLRRWGIALVGLMRVCVAVTMDALTTVKA